MALGAEKVTNGGFPSDTTGWTAYSSSVLASVSGGQSGNCLRITEGGANNPFARQVVSVTPGEVLELNGYVKAGTEATYTVIVRDQTHGVNIWNTGNLEEVAGDWSTNFNHTFEVPALCTSVTIRLYQVASSGAGTTIYYDTVSLKLIGAFARDGLFMGMGIEM